MGDMRSLRYAGLAAALALVPVACGGSNGSTGNGGSDNETSKSGAGLVADVSHPKVETRGDTIIASAQVRLGGVAGKHVTLDWGLVDALQGNESQQERVVKRYVTTRKVTTDTESVRIPVRVATSPLLVHFVLYAPDGTYLDSVDTEDFGKGA
jgi:hypothetical protein